MSAEAGHPVPGSAWVLTANERLARILREEVNLRFSGSGAQVWETPQIAPFSRWCINLWSSSWPTGQLLSVTQELVLWREAVERDEAGAGLLAPIAAAREARRSDQLVRRYGIALHASDPRVSQEEHQAFCRWRKHVNQRLSENDWLTAADIPSELAKAIDAGALAVPARIELVGFLEPLPAAEQAVLDALNRRGTQVIKRGQPDEPPSNIQRTLLADEQQQLRHVAVLLRDTLSACADHQQIPPRIVVAVPDLEGRRAALDSVLRELLAPWSLRGDRVLPWRWERGPKLTRQAQLDVMLAILQLRLTDNAPALISRVLLSSSLWTDQQRMQTARRDYALRDEGFPKLALRKVAEDLDAALADRFTQLATELQAAAPRALPSQWADHFRRCLAAMDWPGSQTLDSLSYQAVQAARDLLERLGTLDAQLGKVPRASALDWLRELAESVSQDARVEHQQPILITSIEDAATLPSDLLIVLDANTAQIPARVRPLPLLPVRMLREAGVAQASPEQWLQRWQGLIAGLMSSCKDIHICSAQVDSSNAQLLPSLLFGSLEDWRPALLEERIGAIEASLSDSETCCMTPEHDPVPAVDALELGGLRAHSGLFKDWFESPFFAFCRHRLGITALPEVPRGLDSRVQGNLIHAVLEDFWRQPDSSAALEALGEDGVRTLLDQILVRQVQRLMPDVAFGPATIRLETERCRSIVLQWLSHERKRLDAFEVVGREVEANPVIAGLPLRLRLDRIDRIRTSLGERWLVMDYKTGREANTRGWKAERMSEPQLPLYASHAALQLDGMTQVNGICFAHLRDGHPALVAMTDWRKRLIEDPPVDMSENWQSDIERWQRQLEQAAREFLQGVAWHHSGVNARSFNADLLLLTAQDLAEEESGESQ